MKIFTEGKFSTLSLGAAGVLIGLHVLPQNMTAAIFSASKILCFFFEKFKKS